MFTDLYIAEVSPEFDEVKHLGRFYDRRDVSADNQRSSDPCIFEDEGQYYLFTAIGPRLHQNIAFAMCRAES